LTFCIYWRKFINIFIVTSAQCYKLFIILNFSLKIIPFIFGSLLLLILFFWILFSSLFYTFHHFFPDIVFLSVRCVEVLILWPHLTFSLLEPSGKILYIDFKLVLVVFIFIQFLLEEFAAQLITFRHYFYHSFFLFAPIIL